MTIEPVTAGHTIVVPNAHRAYLADLDAGTGGHLFVVAMRIAAALRASGLPCDGVNLFYADGAAAFQSVFHAHLHVFARTVGDGFTVAATAWDEPPPCRVGLDAEAEAIRAALAWSP